MLKNILKKMSKHRTGIVTTGFWRGVRCTPFSQEGYQKNVIVYRCINLIARGLASVPLSLYRGEQEIDRHPLLTLLHRVNPYQSRSTFLESVISYLLLTGNTFIQMVCDGRDQPRELYTLRPDAVTLVKDPFLAYQYKNGEETQIFPIEEGVSHLLHLKFFHPLDQWYGLSPLEAAAQAIDQHNTVGGHNLSLLRNGGRPTGALSLKTGPFGLSAEQREELRNDLNQLYQGEQNAGKIVVLEGDFDWKEMGMTPKDLDFIEGKLLAAREIAQAFGVPPMLVGVPGDATFANYREARYHLWEDTILPLLDHFLSELNIWLTPRFGKDLRLNYDPDRIHALSSRRDTLWHRVSQASFLSDNEKREMLGFSPVTTPLS